MTLRRQRLPGGEASGYTDLPGNGAGELWIGPGGRKSAFSSDEERRRQWFRHRTLYLTVDPHPPGKRPWGWWEYEGNARVATELPDFAPDIDEARYPWPWTAEAAALDQMGELRAEEREHLDGMALRRLRKPLRPLTDDQRAALDRLEERKNGYTR